MALGAEEGGVVGVHVRVPPDGRAVVQNAIGCAYYSVFIVAVTGGGSQLTQGVHTAVSSNAHEGGLRQTEVAHLNDVVYL